MRMKDTESPAELDEFQKHFVKAKVLDVIPHLLITKIHIFIQQDFYHKNHKARLNHLKKLRETFL